MKFNHRQELRSSSELPTNLHESGRNKEKVTRSHKETRAAPSTKETCANLVILTPRASPFTKRTIPMNEKKWIIIHAHSRYGGELAVSVSKMFTTMLRLVMCETSQDPSFSKKKSQSSERSCNKVWHKVKSGATIAAPGGVIRLRMRATLPNKLSGSLGTAPRRTRRRWC